MAKISLYDADGKGTGEIEVKDEVFSAPVREHLIHTAVVAYLANQRRGQSRVKTRADVRGGGVKPWRQKGTGRARAGTINSPIWRHGGVAHGPKPRSYALKIPRKILRSALKSALSHKTKEGRLIAVEDLKFIEPKTKRAAEFIKNLKAEGNLLILAERPDSNFIKSFRNIKGVALQDPMSLNVYDVVGSEWIIAIKDAIEQLQKRLSDEKSQ
jgi:large subunit ribosomal protein L4